MARLGSWIEPFPEGIYIKPADAWVDPVAAQGRARWSPTAMPTMPAAAMARCARRPRRWRSWNAATGRSRAAAAAYGESVRLGEVEVSFVPAGHVLGSAQIVLEHKGERVVVSGDYKRRPDPTCPPFEPVPCDIFITEATFGLPVFRHPETASEIDRLLARLHENPERCVLVGAYALGKAQRLIMELRCRGHHEPIYIHGALSGCATSTANTAWRSASFGRPPARRRTSSGARSSSPRPAASTTAGRGACPIRSPPWPRAGCGSASAPASATSSCP